MTEDERHDLLELKAFLEKAIEQTQNELIAFPTGGDRGDYLFLIKKAVMYRESLKKVVSQLKTDTDDE